MICLADSSQQMLETRAGAIFDLFDFDGTAQINQDETVTRFFNFFFFLLIDLLSSPLSPLLCRPSSSCVLALPWLVSYGMWILYKTPPSPP
jgi:hypothetical protein